MYVSLLHTYLGWRIELTGNCTEIVNLCALLNCCYQLQNFDFLKGENTRLHVLNTIFNRTRRAQESLRAVNVCVSFNNPTTKLGEEFRIIKICMGNVFNVIRSVEDNFFLILKLRNRSSLFYKSS